MLKQRSELFVTDVQTLIREYLALKRHLKFFLRKFGEEFKNGVWGGINLMAAFRILSKIIFLFFPRERRKIKENSNKGKIRERLFTSYQRSISIIAFVRQFVFCFNFILYIGFDLLD